MKKIASLVMVSISILLGTGSLQPGEAQPTFELYNKSNDTIWVVLRTKGSIIKQNGLGYFISKPGEQTQLNLDRSQPLDLEICFQAPADEAAAFKRAMESKQALVLDVNCPDISYKLPAKKNLYLTFDSEWRVRPQTGPLKGFLGKTKSGLKLSNNVSSSEVTLTGRSGKVRAYHEYLASPKKAPKKEPGWQKLA